MLTEKILNALRRTLGSRNPIPIHEPTMAGKEGDYVKECLDSTYVSSIGKFVDQFETMLARYTGVKRAVAVINGTAALHIALKLVGVKRGDEVLLPALTFVATANAVTYCGAIPHFVDSEEKTLGLDPHKLRDYLLKTAEIRRDGCYNARTGRRIKAVIPVHIFGHPVDLDPLKELCTRFGLIMVEDAAESLGSFYKGKHTGNWGVLSVLSFNGNKIITTGGGGAILTNDEEMANMAKHLTTTGRLSHQWAYTHDRVGYNYRLPNINAALGCAQVEQLAGFVEKKRALAKRYAEAFQNVQGVRFFIEAEFARSNYWLNVLLLDEENRNERNAILETTNENGIMTRPAWTLMHRLPMYKGCPRMELSVAESLEARLINVPSSATL